MTQETGKCPNGAAAAIHAVYGQLGIRVDHYEGISWWGRGRRRNFVRQCSRFILADSPLKIELPGVSKGRDFNAHARQDRLEVLKS